MMNNSQADNPDSSIPHYPVRLLEAILITLGAIAIVGTGLVGLGIKILDHAFDPERAEAIAKSLIAYTIPGKSQGVFGINIGGAKIAWVRSASNPPDVILFVGEIPTNKEADETERAELDQEFTSFPSDTMAQEFVVTTGRTETKMFCGKPVPITIEQGEQTFSTVLPQPAIRYTARVTENDLERVAILITTGNEAQAKAIAIFNSFRCQ
jgi:hypothetical protein